MRDKSFVTLDACIICGEPKGLMLEKKMRPIFERETVTSIEPCEKCRETYLKEGVMLIYLGDEDYDLVVIKDEAFKEIFGEIPEGKIGRCDKELLDKLRGAQHE